MPNLTAKDAPVTVVKLGGALVDEPNAAAAVLSDLVTCLTAGQRLILVHGGGKRLTATAMRLGVPSTFVAGRRVTDAVSLDVAKMVLAGGVATDLAALGHRLGAPLVPLSGVACGLISAQKRPPRPVRDDSGQTKIIDYGWVGDITSVQTTLLSTLLVGGFVPLIASLGVDADGQVLNINADTVAAAVASALAASGMVTRLLLLTDIDGVRQDPADASSRIPCLSRADLTAMMANGATGGMLPKLASIAACIDAGVHQVQVASWHHPAVISACLANHGIGTRIWQAQHLPA